MSWNGRKIKTFDGVTYNASLYCSHTLAQDSIDGSFAVILTACPVGAKQPCPHVLSILVGLTMYTFENFHGSLKALNGRIELPIPTNIDGVDIRFLGMNVRIYLEVHELEILWDGNRLVVIKASPLIYKRTQGLCGPFDGNMRNDIKSKTGRDMVVGASFLEEWRKPAFDETSDVCVSDKPELTCSDYTMRLAKEVCLKLYSSRDFESCIDGQDKDDLIEWCIDDYCSCDDQSNRNKCACDGVSAYAKNCQMQDIEMKNGWKDLNICREFLEIYLSENFF